MPDSSSSSGSSQSSAGSGSSGSSSARVSTPTLPPDKQHSWKVVGGLVFCLAVIVGAGLLAPRAVAWVVTFLAMGGMMWLIGSAVSGTPWGAFITQRNLISLARFQAVLWTVLILSAYSTYVLQRVNVRGLLKPAAVAPAAV